MPSFNNAYFNPMDCNLMLVSTITIFLRLLSLRKQTKTRTLRSKWNEWVKSDSYREHAHSRIYQKQKHSIQRHVLFNSNKGSPCVRAQLNVNTNLSQRSNRLLPGESRRRLKSWRQERRRKRCDPSPLPSSFLLFLVP